MSDADDIITSLDHPAVDGLLEEDMGKHVHRFTFEVSEEILNGERLNVTKARFTKALARVMGVGRWKVNCVEADCEGTLPEAPDDAAIGLHEETGPTPDVA
jgi:hypothetical protein